MADTVLLINEGRLCYSGALTDPVAERSLEEKFRELTGGTVA